MRQTICASGDLIECVGEANFAEWIRCLTSTNLHSFFLQISVFHTYTFLLLRIKTCMYAQVVISGLFVWYGTGNIGSLAHVLLTCYDKLGFLCIRSGWWVWYCASYFISFLQKREFHSCLSGYFMAPLLFFIVLTPYLWVSLFFLFFYMKSHLWYCSK